MMFTFDTTTFILFPYTNQFETAKGREFLVFAGKKLALLKKFVIQAEPESCL